MYALDPREIDQLHKLEPLARIYTAGERMEAHRQAIGTLARIRGEAVQQLRDGGMSAAEIARRLDVTRQQVHRLQQAVATVPPGVQP